MKSIKTLAIALCAGLVMVGCNNLQKGAAIGAGGGAILGAITQNASQYRRGDILADSRSSRE